MYSRSKGFNSYRRLGQKRPFSRHKQQTVDIALLTRKAQEPKDETEYVATHAFSDFAINKQLKQNIIDRGYVTPTPIQDQAIPHLLEKQDLIGIANTGTGKTAAFLIPLIEASCTNKNNKTLIIVPTRELAVQIYKECIAFSKSMHLFSVLCIGGVNIDRQIQDLRRPHNFLIGTPGRLKDLEEQRKLNFYSYNSIVLDEVDRMLDMGFIPTVKYIISRLPQNRHSLFFSATIPSNVYPIVQSFLKNPITISVKSREASSNVDQEIIRTQGRQKIDVLHDMLAQKEQFEKVLIFGRTKWGIEKLFKLLLERGFRVNAIHGNKNQNQRQRAIEQFKNNQIQILLATDIASRGLDINNVTHVINYDLPASYEDYVHRIGRTGRAEKKGVALTFVD